VRRQFGLPSYEPSEPPPCASLQALPDSTRPHELEDLDRLWQPLDRKLPQGINLHQPFDQPEGRRRHSNGAWSGELFHARRQVRGLPHGGVVHVQIIADSAYYHVP